MSQALTPEVRDVTLRDAVRAGVDLFDGPDEWDMGAWFKLLRALLKEEDDLKLRLAEANQCAMCGAEGHIAKDCPWIR